MKRRNAQRESEGKDLHEEQLFWCVEETGKTVAASLQEERGEKSSAAQEGEAPLAAEVKYSRLSLVVDGQQVNASHIFLQAPFVLLSNRKQRSFRVTLAALQAQPQHCPL